MPLGIGMGTTKTILESVLHFNGTPRIYNKGPNGWYYTLVHQPEQGKIQSNVSRPKNASKQMWVKKTHINQDTLDKTTIENIKQTKAFCNYCCHNGHISFECPLKKTSNMSNVTWVPKKTN